MGIDKSHGVPVRLAVTLSVFLVNYPFFESYLNYFEHLSKKLLIFVSSYLPYRHLTDILKKVHFAYSVHMNLSTHIRVKGLVKL